MSDGMKKKKRPKRPRMDNSEASIPLIMFFFLAIAFFTFFYIVLGGVMEEVGNVHDNLTQSGQLPLSQDRQDSLGVTQGAFSSMPIIFFMLSIVAVLIMAIQARDRVY